MNTNQKKILTSIDRILNEIDADNIDIPKIKGVINEHLVHDCKKVLELSEAEVYNIEKSLVSIFENLKRIN
jgi:hypothetical protein